MNLKVLKKITYSSAFLVASLFAQDQQNNFEIEILLPENITVPGSIDLISAVKKSLAYHPQVKKSFNAQGAVQQDIYIARSDYLPSIDVRAAWGRENSQTETIENEGDYHRTLTRTEYGMTLRQMLFDGHKTRYAVEKQEAFYEGAQYDTEESKHQLALRAIESYLELLRVAEQVDLAKSNVKGHQEIFDIVKVRNDKGLAKKSDLIQVKGRTSLAIAQLEREQARLQSVVERYVEAVGELPARKLVQPKMMNSKIPEKLSKAKQKAVLHHPSLLANRHRVRAFSAGIEEAKGSYYPRIDIELSGGQNDNLAGAEGLDEHYMAMLVLSYNIYRGGGDRAAVISQVYQRERQKEEESELKLAVLRDLAISWYAREGKLVELKYFIEHMFTSEETLKAYRIEYERAERTLFDLLNARSEFFRSKATVIDTKYTNILSSYQILANMGTILEDLQLND